MDKREIFMWLLASLILAFFISPFASPSPDGLEKVAGDKGFLQKAKIRPIFKSPMPDYSWPGIDNESISTGLAGIFGALIVFGVAYGIALIINYMK